MLGEPSREYRKVLHGDDVGTRLSHMVELYDLWNTAYGILTRPDLFHTDLEKARAVTLELALDLLSHHLESEYNLTNYARTINDLSKPNSKPDDPPVTWKDAV